MYSYFQSDEELSLDRVEKKLRDEIASTDSHLQNTNDIQTLVQSNAYYTLQQIISQQVSTLSHDVINSIISYLCYNHFYFGLNCTLNIRHGVIYFILFDINGRPCHRIKSHIINYCKLQPLLTKINTPDHVINLQFVGYKNSYQMQLNSKFVLQHKQYCFLMSWTKNSSEQIPSLYFIQNFSTNPSDLSCEHLYVINNSIFIPLRRRSRSRSQTKSPVIYEIRCRNIISYDYGYVNGENHTSSACEPIWETRDKVRSLLKYKVPSLLTHHDALKSALERVAHCCDCFMFDICLFDEHPGLEFIGKYRTSYINIVGINKRLNQIEPIAKIWFRSRLGIHKVFGIKIVNNRLFMIFSAEDHKVFAGYFYISSHNDYPLRARNRMNRGGILFVLDCSAKIELCRMDKGHLMGNIEWRLWMNRKVIRFAVRQKNKVIEYMIDEELDRIVDEQCIDITGMDYLQFWQWNFLSDTAIEVATKDFIVIKDNDVALRKIMKRNHAKQVVTDGVLLTGLFMALGGITMLFTSLTK